MRWTWDPAAGAIYLHLAGGELDTVDLTGDDPPAEVLLDVGRDTGELAGIEILTADGGSVFTKLAALLKEKPEIIGG